MSDAFFSPFEAARAANWSAGEDSPAPVAFASYLATHAAAQRLAAGAPLILPQPLSLQPPEPKVQPFVTPIMQFAEPWGAAFMRAPGQRNTSASAGGNDNWAQNGCLPTCLSMVLKWWAEQNSRTATHLAFPFAGSGASLNPIETCRRLYGSEFVPCVKSDVPAAKQPGRKADGFDDPSVEWSVNGDAVLAAVKKIRVPVPGTPLSMPMVHLRLKLSRTLAERQFTLKLWLQYGPVIAAMSIPGHFVVVDGFRNRTILVCDPGLITTNSKFWKTKPRPRTAAECLPGQNSKLGQVAIDADTVFTSANGSFNAPWLMQITSIDVILTDFFLDLRPEWSDPRQVP